MKVLNMTGKFFSVSRVAILTVAILVLHCHAWADGVVNNCSQYAADGDGSTTTLEEALMGGGNVTFACDGTIVVPGIIINTDTILDATGHNVTLSGSNSNRILLISSSTTVEVNGLTISNGYCHMDTCWGAIENKGTLTIAYSTVTGNSSSIRFSGGIYNTGALTVTNSTLSGNSSGYGPGGIYNTGTVTVTNSTLSGNSSTYGDGGGIMNSYQGEVTITDCTLSHNLAGREGGALRNLSGKMAVINSTLSGNSAGERGGAIENVFGELTVLNSTVSNNTANVIGGGISIDYGEIVLTASTVSGNWAYHYGGGIWNYEGNLAVIDCTFSGNSAERYGGGFFVRGDNPWGYHGKTIIQNTSIVQNRAGLVGGGVLTAWGGKIDVANSILANDGGGNCGAPGDLAGYLPSDQGYNLSSDDSCSFVQPTSMNNVDPMLGPLADNGGPTQTHALLSGSPAIDAGDCSGGVVVADQRGVSRPQDGDGDGLAKCDIGAFEYVIPLTPTQQIEHNIQDLINSGVLTQQQGDVLLNKVTNVEDKLASGNPTAACNNLGAFINQVSAYVNSHRLTPEQGQALIDYATAYQGEIPCT
jgi:hypothetical protein